MIKFLSALFVLPLLAVPAFGQVVANEKTYILAKEAKPLLIGRTFITKQRVVSTKAKMKITGNGGAIEGEVSISSDENLVLEYLAEDKIRVTYQADETERLAKISGQEELKETISAPTEGKVVILSKKNGEWTTKLEKRDVKKDEKKTSMRRWRVSLGDFPRMMIRSLTERCPAKSATVGRWMPA